MTHPFEHQREALEALRDAMRGPHAGVPALNHIVARLDAALGKGTYPAPLVGDLNFLRAELIDFALKLERLFSDEPLDREEMQFLLSSIRVDCRRDRLFGMALRDVHAGIDEAIGPDED